MLGMRVTGGRVEPLRGLFRAPLSRTYRRTLPRAHTDIPLPPIRISPAGSKYL